MKEAIREKQLAKRRELLKEIDRKKMETRHEKIEANASRMQFRFGPCTRWTLKIILAFVAEESLRNTDSTPRQDIALFSALMAIVVLSPRVVSAARDKCRNNFFTSQQDKTALSQENLPSESKRMARR